MSAVRISPCTTKALVTGLCCVVLAACGQTPEEHLASAQRFYADRELDSAVIELRNALQQEPGLADARLLLGRSYLELGDFASSIVQFENAAELGVADATIAPLLALARFGDGRYDELLASLDGADLTPELQAITGLALLGNDDLDGAAAALDAALAADDSVAHAHFGSAWLADLRDDPASAAGHFQRATELAPLDRGIWLAKGAFELSRNDPDGALRSFEAALALPGSVVPPRIGMARTFIVSGRLEEARAQLAQVMAATQNFIPGYYLQGLIGVIGNQDQVADEALQQVERSDSDYLQTPYLMGIVKYRLGQTAQAEERLRKHVARNPQSTPGRKLLAAIQALRGDLDAARSTLQPLAAISADAQYVAMLGSICLRLADYECAMENLGRAVTLEPGAAAYQRELALGLLGAGDTAGAVGTLETAVDVDDSTFESDYFLILVNIVNQDYQAALDTAEALAARVPEDPMARNFVGAAHIGLQQRDEALAAFEAALAIDPAFTPAVVNMARLHQQSGDIKLAATQFEALLARVPGNLTALTGLASLAASSGDLAEAVRHLRAAEQAHPQRVEPKLSLARIARAQGDMNGAIAATGRAMQVQPQNVNVLLAHADLLLSTTQTDAAWEFVVQADARAGPDIAVATQARLGRMLQQVGETGRARARYRDALQIDPNDVASLIALVRIDTADGRLAPAAANLDALASLVDDQATLALLRGDLAARGGRPEEALALYRTAADAGQVDAALRIAAVHGARGDAAAAREVLEAWLANDPRSVPVRLALGGLLINLREIDAAVPVYESLYVDIPGNPAIMNNLAWLYAERSDNRAFPLAEEAHRIAPGNASVADTYGWLLLQAGRTNEALEVLQKTVSLDDSRPVFHYHLAAAYLEAGDEVEARRSVERALAMGDFPDRERAEALLRSLE